MAAKYIEKVIATAQLMMLVERTRYLQGFTIKSEGPDGRGGVIFKISSGINLASWGEKIDLHMFPYNDQQTMIEIKSECEFPTQVVDWGQNKRNVEKILSYLLNGIMVQKVQTGPIPTNNYWGQNK